MKVKVGDTLVDSIAYILTKDGPEKVSTNKFFGNQKTILFGLPGAFTPTCSAKHLPGYVNSLELAKEKNIHKIICVSVNDAFVMDAWAKNQGAKGKIEMLADAVASFTKSIGAELDLESRGLGLRSSRYAMLIENLKVLKISEEKVAKNCEVSAAENFLKGI